MGGGGGGAVNRSGGGEIKNVQVFTVVCHRHPTEKCGHNIKSMPTNLQFSRFRQTAFRHSSYKIREIEETMYRLRGQCHAIVASLSCNCSITVTLL